MGLLSPGTEGASSGHGGIIPAQLVKGAKKQGLSGISPLLNLATTGQINDQKPLLNIILRSYGCGSHEKTANFQLQETASGTRPTGRGLMSLSCKALRGASRGGCVEFAPIFVVQLAAKR